MRRHRLLKPLLIGLALCWAFPVSASVDPVATKKELQQIQNRIQDLQKDIKRTQSRRSATEQALQKAEQAISDTRRKLREVNRSMTQSEAKLAELRRAQQDLNRAKEAQRAALKQDINAAYRAGRQEYVKLLLNQEQPDKMARLMKYYDYYHQARMARIQAFNQTLRDIKDNEISINEEVAELSTLKQALANEQQQLQAAKERRKQALAKLDSSLKNDASRVTSLKASQAELEEILHQVQATLSDLPSNVGKQPFAQLKGKLAWPSQGRVIKRFGNRRDSGALRWNGVLIRTAEGSTVKAVHHGRVVFSDWMRGFGMLTIVDHGDGYLSLYGHNETLLKSPGDWVDGGEVIAYSGRSGGQEQASLYFEIRKNGKPENPSRWCRG
ncbi:MAG: hypothetical protein CMK83_25385 [Pseudomonadales bacterium]|jgi:murein hydrolase activator|nr:hypothetical protein [Pseudomonadales bacterium]TNC85768.1 MAG: hypothetical protein CSH49_17315 [Alcanivorax sp.]HAG92908.1 hypothetical protein [Gammaproteobacteria bacterium]MBI27266.1 hypothetical protein [Pseudomonadales bacterium]HAU16159.1 hypothetical protein [Gammaproteobacteria bacterium]|tara:strand:- start:534 stop:1685 length:1152 start_codon:yes stop_codon:yes gene_type:complete